MANPIRRAASLPSRQKALSLNGWTVADPGYTLGSGFSDWSTQRAVEEGMKKSHWVYAAVRRISQAAASVPWVAVDGSGDDTEDLPDHPLTKLLARPNEYTSGQDLIERIAGHLYLGGNAVLVKTRGKRKEVAELWPVMPDRIEPMLDDEGYLVGYDYTNRRGRKMPTLKPSEVTHFQFVDPANEWWGMSPLQSVARVVDTDIDAVRWNHVALKNRAVPDGVLSTNQELQDEEYERMQEHMRSKTARESLILEKGLSWQQMSLSPAEMDFVNSRKMSREDILSVFGVPPAMLGIVQSATQSDVHAMRSQFWQDTVVPFLRDLESTLNLSLAPEFGPNISVRPQLQDVEELKSAYQDRILDATRLWYMGVTLAEINRVLELGLSEENLPNAFESFVPAAIVPTDEAGDEQAEEEQNGIDGNG